MRRRRFAVKPKNLKLKTELFHVILFNPKKFEVIIKKRSPLGHYVLISFIVDGVEYSGMRQLYVRHSAVDTIRFQMHDKHQKRSKTLTKNELENLNKAVRAVL